MAKRARGGGRRPGQRRPTQRTGPRPATASARPDAVAPPEPLDVAVDATEAPTPRPSAPARTRSRASSSAFEESAAQEYAYVASDVRRIAIVGGSMFAVLIALFILIEVLGVIHI
jgi:hypothetical protein